MHTPILLHDHIPATADLVAWDRQYLWHPFTPMKPWCESKPIVVIERGEREFLIDTEGRRYIDGVSSLWCNVHGHNVPELNAAVVEQLSQIAHSTLLGLANVPSILLARRLVELTRRNGLLLDKVFYSDNGSTAVEVACKMAFQYWRNLAPSLGQSSPASANGHPPPRSRFIAFDNAYHGDTLGAVSLGGIPLFHHTFKSLTFPVDFIPVPAHTDNGRATLDYLAALLRDNADAYAAIIVEPLIQGAGGMLTHPPGFLSALRALSQAHNTLLIADEVLTGFGRTGTMFACQQERVTPDFLCLSKGLTGGYMPLGATLTTQAIFDAFYVDPNQSAGAEKTFFHGHTFTGHPLACAVALASLDLFEKNHLLAHVQSLMPLLAELLDRARAASPFVHSVRQCGLIAALDLAQPGGTPFPARYRIAAELCHRLRSSGILLRPLADTLVLMPPLAITRENLQYLCDSVFQALHDLPAIVEARTVEMPTP